MVMPVPSLRRAGVRLVLAACVAVSGPGREARSQSGDDPRIDPITGVSRANYPPPRHFDHLHMRLEIDVPDMRQAYLTACQRLRMVPVGRPRDTVVLDAVGMTISEVAVEGQPVRFTHAGGTLRVHLPRAVSPGTPIELTIRYALDFIRGRGEGLTHTPGRPDAASVTDRFPQVFSQGQPEYNRRWFPCHDFPNERLTTELLVTVEDPYVVCSNGRLVRTWFGGRAGGRTRTTWHWLQDQPHAAYLVTLVIGRFSIVGLAPPGGGEPRNAAGVPVPCYLYAPLGQEPRAARVYAGTPAMMAFFGEMFGPYPWDKYSQALVRGFMGGMENTSATTMLVESLRMRDAESLIAHELVHQWFGDLVTCRSWEHAWLNEGWASYGEALWAAHRAGPGGGQRAYQRVLGGFLARQRLMNRESRAPDVPPMVSRLYTHPMQNFMKADDIYAKGALVLHMLRRRMGDEAFFAGARLYLERHRLGEVETEDFRRCLEEVSGLSLERFFEQWCRRPGLPHVLATVDWASSEAPGADAAGTLTVTIEQTQPLDAWNPAYEIVIPVRIVLEDGSVQWLTMHTDVRRATHSLALPVPPRDVEVNPELTTAAFVRVNKSLAMWLHQAVRGSTLLARWQAIGHLGSQAAPVAWGTLAAALVAPGQEAEVRRVAGAWLAARMFAGPADGRRVARVSGGVP